MSMKPSITACMMLLSWMSLPGTAADDVALLIGVTDYQHARMNDTSLKFPEADAKAVGDLLREAGYDVTVLTGQAATSQAIQDALDQLSNSGTHEGVAIVGLFGHGTQYGNEAFYGGYDTRVRALKDADGKSLRDEEGKLILEPDPESMVSMRSVLDTFSICGYGGKLLLADCCREDPHAARGRAFGSNIKVSDLPPNTAALFACSANEKAFEHDEWGHGAFTKAFLDACRSSPNVSANGLSHALYQDVQKMVRLKAGGQKQTVNPIINGFVDLHVQLARVITPTPQVARVPRPEMLSAPFSLSTAKQSQTQWAEYLKQPIDYRNKIGMSFKLIPAGKFRMGSSESSPSGNESPHMVEISKPFYAGKYETTVGEFSKFVAATGYRTTLERTDNGQNRGWDSRQQRFNYGRGFSWRNPGWQQANDHPVVNVSWEDANAFVKWLETQEQRRYRLLSEAEWEYCCRAGTTSLYTVGNDPSSLTKVGNVLDNTGLNAFRADSRFVQERQSDAIRGTDGTAFTASVGQYLANNFGLHDLHGNVCEWCQDWYSDDYGPNRSSNPKGALYGNDRSARGGRFDTGRYLAKSFTRNHGSPQMSDMILGLRVALEIE